MEEKVMSYGRLVSRTHAMQEAYVNTSILSQNILVGDWGGDNFVTLENTCLICGIKTCRKTHIYYDRGRYKYINPGRFNTEEENREEEKKEKIEKELNELENYVVALAYRHIEGYKQGTTGRYQQFNWSIV